jgi:dTMP kinase
MRKARYICIEGCEGVGKTTQTQKLVDHLRNKGYNVLQTKEPGTSHAPLTMTLRGIMLDAQHEEQMTPQARELISQAIRSIHLDRVVKPAMNEYDFIIQDRGMLSGMAYGTACGNNINDLKALCNYIGTYASIYDKVVVLTGNIERGLKKALSSKQEFAAGDAMEARGVGFITSASKNMSSFAADFPAVEINVDNKDIEQVFKEILNKLELEE